MNNLIYLLSFSLSLIAQDAEIHGSLRSIMQGDLQAKFDLKVLNGKENIYGLGAVADLKGEIIVINSKPYISQVLGNEIVIDTTFNHKASLFAFNNIETWTNDTISDPLSMLDLEERITKKATDLKEPISFLLTCRVESLKWHVIDWQEGDSVHTHQKHKNAGIHGEIKDENVLIFGFYSRSHKGILTHRNSNLHMHFINKNKTISGHVDDLIIEKGVLQGTFR